MLLDTGSTPVRSICNVTHKLPNAVVVPAIRRVTTNKVSKEIQHEKEFYVVFCCSMCDSTYF